MSAYRSESLKLYRDILRATRLFTWNNEQGISWGLILRQNARKEFEIGRLERDPTQVTRMLFLGRDCLNQTMEKYSIAAQKIQDNIDKTRTDRR
jgi:hypothetical protein